MFQQGSKIYLNASNWKFFQDLNYNNNHNNSNGDIYRDIKRETEKAQHLLKKLSCNLKGLKKSKNSKNSHKTGIRRTSSVYSVSSVKERFASEAGSNTGIDIYSFKQKMANTLSVMTNVLRNVVSKQRIRYKEKGFNLDLAYVCDNIIAMGYPAEKYESMYRNRLEDVYKFLEENHHDHYKIYNLCLERSYDITKFHGRVSVYPFEDHNPPTIELILNFCEDVDNWLKANSLNVAAVHCKAGKGRTGTMICCYLLYSGQQRTAEDALACYDEKRTKDRKGVTIPSQRRYVQYFSKLMRLGLSYERRTLQFCEIRFSEVHTLQSQGTVHCSISVLQEKVQQLQNFPIDFRKNSILDMKNPPLPVTGDIKVELTKNAKKLFHFWFNTFFVIDCAVIEGEGKDVKLVYTLHKWEIDDAHKDKEHKCFSEDFKVELVFYVDDTNIDRDHIKVSSSNRLSSNHRSTMQNAAVRTSTQHQQQQQQQSNNYSLPQNNSSGSEINYICDQKSSSSASVSSSLGGGGTDISNDYESNKSTAQRNSAVQPFVNHHSNHFLAATTDINKSSVIFTTEPLMQHMIFPQSYMDQQLQQQHKTNMPQHHQLQQQKTLSLTTNPRHLQRQVAGGNDSSNGSSIVCGGGNIHANKLNHIDATCLPSANINANNPSSISSCKNNKNMTNNSFNHNHSSNSSKTSSVSSESSSSAIGDNEEDWESGESQAKQVEHITFLLSTSSVTSPTSTLPSPPLSSTTTLPSNNPASPSPSIYENKSKALNSAVPDFSNTSSSTSISKSNSSNFPFNNKSKTINSSCTNRVVDGDDDDDDDDLKNNDDDDKKLKLKKLNLNHVVKTVPTTTDTNSKSIESKGGDNNITGSIVCEADQTALVPASTSSAHSSRHKLMHLLMAPKNPQQSAHKPIFKRKSSYKLVKGSNSSNCGASTITDCSDDSLASLAANSGSGSGGVATSSKQKLKIKLKKNKLKLSQKFQWFQSYFRSDPVDFCENFVQQTTSMRRNSMCSMASRTHKLSTTTPPSVTPPPPPANVEASYEQLDRSTSAHSVSTSNASIATGDLCEDYYSSICDNQLSFSNSPCKSPRSMADMASSISGASGVGGNITHGSSFSSSFTRSTGSYNPYLRERRETLSGCSSHVNSRRSNVVVVAAKPAKVHAIGFNVNSLNLARQDSFETNGEDDVDTSPASIYYTPSSAVIPNTGDADEHAAFVFPQIQQESNLEPVQVKNELIKSSNYSASTTSKPQAKYSLNLVIVKECSEPTPSNTSNTTESNNESDGIESDCCDHNPKVDEGDNRLQDYNGFAILAKELENNKITTTTSKTSASVCSNSSSSGFCTSECCTTNSSSSSCNCNPFAMDLERHIASVKQEPKPAAAAAIQDYSGVSNKIDNETLDNLEEKANFNADILTNTNKADANLKSNSSATLDRQ